MLSTHALARSIYSRLTWDFKDLNLSRRVRSALVVCLAVPRGLDSPSASRVFEADADALRCPKTRPDHLVKRP
jgi:hypothetical protein